MDQRNILSQLPTVADSTRPSWPNIHSLTEASCALFPVNVLSTQPLLLSESTENRFNDQISKMGSTSHCVYLIICAMAHRNRDWSGVDNRSME